MNTHSEPSEMTLRDYFAGQALPEMIRIITETGKAKDEMGEVFGKMPDLKKEMTDVEVRQVETATVLLAEIASRQVEIIARDSYAYADAMIKEREK